MPKSRGFTLIELLVTISIISILSAVGLVIYSSVMKQGRDTKRQSDLRSIQSAVEQYYADNFSYPAQAQVSSGGSIIYNGKTYMNTVPSDPVGSGSYRYVYTSAPSSYCLYANLEKPIPGYVKPSTCTDNTYNFAVSPP